MKNTKPYTISEVRTNLYSIVKDIFTDSFSFKYHQYIVEIDSDPDKITSAMAEHSSEINILVGDLVYNRKNPEALDSIIRSHSSKILAGLYFRYYWLTNYLISQKQDDEISLPIIPEEFFTELLINYWLIVLPE